MKKTVYKSLCLLMLSASLLSCSSKKDTPDTPSGDKPSAEFEGSPIIEVPSESMGVTLKGMGVELDPHFLSQNVTRSDGATVEDWANIVVKRSKLMQTERFRVMVLPHWWEPYNDDDDPNHFNWDAFTFENKEMKSLYAVLDLAQEMNADVTLVLWGCHINASTLEGGQIGRHFLANDGSNWVTGTKDNDEFAECFAALVKYLLETKKYSCIKEITPYNEPDGNVAPIKQYINTCIALDEKFKAEGLRDKVNFNLSDNTDGAVNYLLSCANNLKDQADLFNSHTYIFGYDTKNSDIMSWEQANVNAAQVAGKSHFVGEFGSNQCVGSTRQKDISTYERGILMTRIICNVLNAGACGTSYWSLLDQYYGKNESYTQMQQLGLWIYKARAYNLSDLGDFTEDYECRPQYYAYSMLTRFIRKGSVVYPLDFDDDFVAGTAVLSPEGKWTYVIANPTGEVLYYRLKNGNQGGMNQCDIYNYQKRNLPSDGSMIQSAESITPYSGAFEIKVSARSVVVLTQIGQ